MTNAEDKLMDMLIDIFPDKGFVFCTCALAREYDMTDEVIKYIEDHPDAKCVDIGKFVCFEDYDGECKIDRE